MSCRGNSHKHALQFAVVHTHLPIFYRNRHRETLIDTVFPTIISSNVGICSYIFCLYIVPSCYFWSTNFLFLTGNLIFVIFISTVRLTWSSNSLFLFLTHCEITILFRSWCASLLFYLLLVSKHNLINSKSISFRLCSVWFLLCKF